MKVILKKENFRFKQMLLLAFVLCTTSFIYSQNRLNLRVFDEKDHPVEFANFRLFRQLDSTVIKGEYSDEAGRILLQDFSDGDYFGIVSFFGYEEYRFDKISFSPEKSKQNFGKIHLSVIKSQEFEEVVVRGKEKSIMESGIDKRTYNVDKDISVIGGEAADILNNIPSVEVDNDGNVSLRGNSAVKILINGRESALTSGDNPLDGIPASAIEKVEIVTNPSAKYDPEGTAGIINIIMKKSQLRGFNANVQLSVATQNLFNGSLGFNYRNEKLNLFANYSYRYEDGSMSSLKERRTNRSDTTELLHQTFLGQNLRKSHSLGFGTDFFIKENQEIGFSISGSSNNRSGIGEQRNEIHYNDVLNYYGERITDDPRGRKSIDLNAHYLLKFKEDKGTLMFDITESIGENNSYGDFEEYFYWADGTPLANNYLEQYQQRDGKNNKFTFSADLDRKINDKMKYEAGIQVRLNEMYQKNLYEYLDSISGETILDPNATNELQHNENIYSAYGIFGHSVTDYFKYQIGVRLEQASVSPVYLMMNESLNYDYFTAYPSIHLMLGTEKTGTAFISYTRRVNRPSPWQMNPFPSFDDPLNVRQGNPGLLPEFINSYELGYEKNWNKGGISSTLYLKHTQNKIQRITQFRDDGVNISTFANIDQGYDYGLEIIGNYTPFSWWRNMISFNTYESQVSANFNGTELSNKGITWDVKANITFSLFKNTTTIQFNGAYSAPRYTVQGTFYHNHGFDAGITRTFLDRKLMIGLKLSDIFDMRGFKFTVKDQGREQTTHFTRTSRRLYFTLSYRFGNLKASDKQRRKFEGGGGDMDMM